MPQILSIGQRLRHVVTLNTAGDNQVAICAPIIYLEATVSGDLQYHTTTWEQMSGSPAVDLVYVSPTQSYYLVVGPPGTDKVFRFTIDKDTPFEQYKEVTVFTTPTTMVTTIEMGSGSYGNIVDAFALPWPAVGTAGASFDPSIPFNSLGAVIDASYTMGWFLPQLFYDTPDTPRDNYRSRFMGTIIQKWLGSSWDAGTIYGINDTREYSVVLNDRVRIGAVYSINATQSEAVFNQWFDTDGTGIVGYNTFSQIEFGSGDMVSTLDRTIYSLQLFDQTESIIDVQFGSGAMAEVLTRISYTLELRTETDSISSVELGGGALKFTLTRVSGGSLGG